MYCRNELTPLSNGNLTSSTSCLSVLTSDSQVPRVSQTTMGSHLLELLNIISQLGLQVVSKNVVVLTIVKVLLSVQEPSWNLIFGWVLHDLDNSLQLFLGQFTGSLIKINIGLLANQVGVSSTNTSDSSQSVDDLNLTVNVCVHQTAKNKFLVSIVLYSLVNIVC